MNWWWIRLSRSDYVRSAEYNKLFVFMQYENVLAVRVSLETGLRIGDILKLRPRDLRGRTISYVSEKTGKKGRAVISLDLANRLKAIAGAEYIFPKRGKPSEHRTRQTVWRDVKRAATALRAAGAIGSENISPHSARKTFAVEDAEAHGLLHTQRALQHRDKNTTKLYAFSDRYVGNGTDSLLLQRIMSLLSDLSEKFDEMMTNLQEKSQ